MLVDREKEWDNYKMEIIIKKGWEIIIEKLIFKIIIKKEMK
jgi:hypothetical protein